MVLESVGIGVLSGLVRGGFGYNKNRRKKNAKFEPKKLAKTVIIYAIAGVLVSLFGISQQEAFGISEMLLTTGFGVLLEEVLKSL